MAARPAAWAKMPTAAIITQAPDNEAGWTARRSALLNAPIPAPIKAMLRKVMVSQSLSPDCATRDMRSAVEGRLNRRNLAQSWALGRALSRRTAPAETPSRSSHYPPNYTSVPERRPGTAAVPCLYGCLSAVHRVVVPASLSSLAALSLPSAARVMVVMLTILPSRLRVAW